MVLCLYLFNIIVLVIIVTDKLVSFSTVNVAKQILELYLIKKQLKVEAEINI